MQSPVSLHSTLSLGRGRPGPRPPWSRRCKARRAARRRRKWLLARLVTTRHVHPPGESNCDTVARQRGRGRCFGGSANRVIIYDAGALVAAERNVRSLWALHDATLRRDLTPIVPAGVLAQVCARALRPTCPGSSPAVA